MPWYTVVVVVMMYAPRVVWHLMVKVRSLVVTGPVELSLCVVGGGAACGHSADEGSVAIVGGGAHGVEGANGCGCGTGGGGGL